MSKLLKDTIMRLHLDPSAKFPSELAKQEEENKTAMDKILAWRATQERTNRAHGIQCRDDEDLDEEPQYD